MKKYLLSLLLICVWFISFCSAWTFVYNTHIDLWTINSSSALFPLIQVPFDWALNWWNYTVNCIISNFSWWNSPYFDYLQYRAVNYGYNWTSLGLWNRYCYWESSNILSSWFSCSMSEYFVWFYTTTAAWNWSNSSFDLSCTFVWDTIKNSVSCDPQYTSEECQTEYSLVPSSDLSSCNSNLSGCMTNLDNYASSLNTCSSNLNNCNTSLSSCMSSNCPVSSWNISWSSLFINNIQHLGAPIIDITIPEEFDWDYVSTDEEFILDIEWYNVDTEYMDWIITTQTTLPNEIDFNNLISSVIPLFIPWLVVILFLYFIFRFIKKIF